MERWSIRLERESFRFSAAHFLIFPDGTKEQLHGHNYRVRVQISGPLSQGGLVLEFSQGRKLVQAICDSLHERWLLPAKHPGLQITNDGQGHCDIVFGALRYRAPTAEVLTLDLDNISVENLAAHVGRQLRTALVQQSFLLSWLWVAVGELPGQEGVWEWTE